MLLEDFLGLEYAFVAETANAEVLEPHMLAEAKHRPDWPLWEKVIEEELAMLKATGTWKLEEAPPGANIIGSKLVFKAKKDTAGNVICYKARLVAQGFSQIGGIDYDDTYAPVACLTSSHMIIAMANCLDLELHQVDIKGAYLNGVLNDNEVLYMQHAPGYKAHGVGHLVLHLLKMLYSLKQSGWCWYQKLSSIFTSLSFKQCSIDQAIFYKTNKELNALTVVAVHVNDCMIAVNSDKLIHKLIEGLWKQLEVTDLGGLHWMLRVEIQCDHVSGTTHLSQHVYIDSILCHYNLADLKLLSMPMDTLIWLSTKQAPTSVAECVVMHDVLYCEAISVLNWAVLATCLDIAFTVMTMARFAANPSPVHWEAVKWIFCYLAGTCDLWLLYRERKQTLKGYADADGSMAKDRQAISGYAFLIDGSAVSWSFKHQKLVSLSTTKSKYIAATHGMKEALWLHSLLTKLFSSLKAPTTLFSDNQAVITLTSNHQYHAHMKHIDVHYHFIQWVIEQGSLCIIY